MKLTAFLLIVACLQVGARGFSQKVTYSGTDQPLQKIFEVIHEQTGFGVLMDHDLLVASRKVTLKVKDASLDEVLKACLQNQPFKLDYTIIGHTINVIQKVDNKMAASLEISAAPLSEIHGKVVDSGGKPLRGAYVALKDSKTVTSTDDNGNFSLENIPESAILIISHVGYENMEIKVGDKSEITIHLKEHSTTFNEVSVIYQTGYQAVAPDRATGSFAQPDKVMYNNRVSTDVISKLEGITSGLVFNRDYLGNPNFQIRGASTINANPTPLIVVDNFPYSGDINNINPNDVESVTVLKDAAAASIWGAQAGNGVIVITTKRGRFSQPLKVDFSANVTVSKKPDLIYNRNFLNANDFINVEKNLFSQGFYDANLSDPTAPPISPVVQILAAELAGAMSSADAVRQIDAFRSNDVRKDEKKYYYQGLANQQYAVNASGGNENANFVMSLGYDQDLSSLKRNSNHRITTNTFGTFKLSKKLEISGGINYVQGITYNNNTIGDLNAGGESNGYAMYPYAKLADQNGNPLPIVKDYNGNFVQSAKSNGFLNWSYFPLTDMQLANNETNSYDIRLRGGVKYEIIDGLNLEGIYQYEAGESKKTVYHSDSTYYARNLINQYANVVNGAAAGFNIPVGGILDLNDVNQKSTSGRGQLNFKRTFRRHSISALAGLEARQVTGLIQSATTIYGYNPVTNGYSSMDYTAYYDLYPSGSSGTIPNNYFKSNRLNRYRSYFGNAAYTYNNLYTITGSVRIDQANIFGQKANSQSLPLYSFGGKWNISNERFYKNKWLTNLALRSTYGYQGNILNSGTAYPTARYANGVGNILPPQYQFTTPGDPSLTWEKIGQFNLGLDFTLIRKTLSGSIEYYHKNGQDLIGSEPVPSSTGFTTATTNYANIKGHGFDVALQSKNIAGAFEWTTNLLLSSNSNTVTKYIANTSSQNGYTVVPGKPVDGLYTYKWIGLDLVNGNPQGIDTFGKVSENYDELVLANAQHRQYSGRLNPSLFGSIRNTFSYRGFSLSINISYKFGYYFERSSINYYSLYYQWQGNVDFANRWQKPGDEKSTNVPSISPLPINQSRDQFYNGSSSLATKADNIRLQDAFISYDFNESRWLFVPFRHIQLLVYANNLGLLWKANKYNIDPDYSGAQYVAPRTYSFSIKANF